MLQNIFFSSVYWNTIESIIYHALFLLHQYFLYACIGSSAYGTTNIFFSMIYLVVYGIDFGFEPLLPFRIKELQSSRSAFRAILFQALPTLIALLIIALGAVAITEYEHHYIALMAIAIISEYIRRVGKHILQLFLQSDIASITEIGMLICYIALVWISYAFDIALTPLFLIALLTITSLCTVIGIIYTIYTTIYVTLPDHTEFSQLPMQYTNRAYAYIYTFVPQLFSTNFLIPFLALHVPLHQAGVLKLIHHTIQTASVIIRKIFGTSGNILIAYSDDENRESASEQLIYTSHFAIALTSIVTVSIVAAYTAQSDLIRHQILWWYSALALSDMITISYEKTYLINNAYDLVCLEKLATIIGMACLIATTQSLTSILIGILFVRVLSSITIILVSRVKWNSPIPYTMHIAYTIHMLFTLYVIFAARA